VFNRPNPFLQKALRALSKGSIDETILENIVEHSASLDCLLEFHYGIELLKKRAFLNYTISNRDIPLVTLVPLTSAFSWKVDFDDEKKKLHLSRFCFLRFQEDKILIETPLAPCHLVIHDEIIIRFFYALKKPQTVKELAAQFPTITTDVLKKILDYFLKATVITHNLEDQNDALNQWEFHDLLFHTRHRVGRHANPYGGLYPFKKTIAPKPARKPAMSERSITLYKPDIASLKEKDKAFTAVLENRQSIRKHGEKPISAEELGEFLFRAARIREHFSHPEFGETLRKCYPAGGAIHELELYPIIQMCTEIEPGAYHYNHQLHTLEWIEADEKKIQALLSDACSATGITTPPQILFLITARFQRLSWKYRSMAYATTLKNTGVLLQTLYLVATAMDLAPCAIGGGDADLFAEAFNTEYLEESSVGEFMLGSRPIHA
jgi:SagB-type dehydrogenase family enzyme